MLVACPASNLNAFIWAWPSLLILMTTSQFAANYNSHEKGLSTCPKNKVDVIFLIDSSTSVDRENFSNLLHVVSSTVQLMNVSADETRVGMTKFTGTPVTEFSLNDFDNKEKLLETIDNVKYIAGVTHLGAAIQYVTDREFTHSKGDRANVANVMVIMSDGLAQDDVIQPSARARTKDIEFVAVAVGKFYGKEQFLDITGGRIDRILRYRYVNKTVDISQHLSDAILKAVDEQCSRGTTTSEKFTTSTAETISSSTRAPYTPLQSADIITNCKDGSMEVTVSRLPAYRGWLLVKGQQKKQGCFWDYTKNSESSIRSEIDYDVCQAEKRRSANPDGVFVSMTILLLKHPLLFQYGDQAYRIQCFYGGRETFVHQELQIEELSSTKTLQNVIEKPDCVYTIRRGTVNGPIVKFAMLGMDVVHRWECESAENDGGNVYAMHVHSCYVKSETQEQVMVIDENGCPVEHSPIQKITYHPNQLLVSAKAPVVSLPDTGAIQFNCQVSLCLRVEESCRRLAPPKCDSSSRSVRNVFMLDEINDPHSASKDVIDLNSPMLFVLDFHESRPNQPEDIKNANDTVTSRQLNFICWSFWKYVVTAAITGTFLTANAVVTFHMIRKR
uniref:ZP domain-containing protein n=1 Tax=Trichuris muris TaxID=70415 RepID=A0A5S6QFX8_TRIMR